jgi:hypothetical protein
VLTLRRFRSNAAVTPAEFLNRLSRGERGQKKATNPDSRDKFPWGAAGFPPPLQKAATKFHSPLVVLSELKTATRN